MKSPISVIILSYNRKAYLGTAIESVLAQTYPHFELLIWDDGSTDGSLELAHRYAERDARVRVVSAPHSGVIKARQQAIAQTRYEYLGWVDSDDWLAPTALAETMAVLDAHPEVGLVYTDHVQIDQAGHVLGRGRNSQIPYSQAGMLVDFLTFHFRLLRRSLYDQVGGLDAVAGAADDYDLCLKLSEITQVHHLRQPLYHYRIHPHSLSQQDPMAQVQCSKQAIERALERRGLSDRLQVKLTLKPIGHQQVVQFSLVRKRSPQSVTPIAPVALVPTAAPAPVAPAPQRAVVPGPWLTPSFWRTGVLLAATLPITGLFSAAAIAQSVNSAHDRAGTTVNRNGNEFNITGGQRNGGNLFHSFERFGLNRNEVANFLTDAQVQNVLGRVTGGDPSVIDGLLRVTGSNANLFLLNPAGILFGANARLDLPASFLATTASGIGFDNGWFSATGEVNYSSLAGNPTSYAFSLAQPGAIVNAGDLSLTDGASLTLLAGTVVNTGSLSAPGGQVTVAAVPGENLVRLSQPGSLLSLDIAPLGNNGPNPLPFTAQALPELLTGGNLPDATGLIVNPDGTVSLASGTVIPTGAGTAIASGTVDVSSPNRGGTAAVLGDRVALVEANINATGTSGGGTLLIGGDYHGGGSV
ncbi:MAG TPA: glycosyltransferase, partial [Chroococcidiopsis sp.]